MSIQWNEDTFCHLFLTNLLVDMGWLKGERLVADLYASVSEHEPENYYERARSRIKNSIDKFVSEVSLKIRKKKPLDFFMQIAGRDFSLFSIMTPSGIEFLERVSEGTSENLNNIQIIIDSLKEKGILPQDCTLLSVAGHYPYYKNANYLYKNIEIEPRLIRIRYPLLSFRVDTRESYDIILKFMPWNNLLGLGVEECDSLCSYFGTKESIELDISPDHYLNWWLYCYLREVAKGIDNSMLKVVVNTIDDLYNNFWSFRRPSESESISNIHLHWEDFEEKCQLLDEFINNLVDEIQFKRQDMISFIRTINPIYSEIITLFNSEKGKDITSITENATQILKNELPYSDYFFSTSESFELNSDFSYVKELFARTEAETTSTLTPESFSVEYNNSPIPLNSAQKYQSISLINALLFNSNLYLMLLESLLTAAPDNNVFNVKSKCSYIVNPRAWGDSINISIEDQIVYKGQRGIERHKSNPIKFYIYIYLLKSFLAETYGMHLNYKYRSMEPEFESVFNISSIGQEMNDFLDKKISNFLFELNIETFYVPNIPSIDREDAHRMQWNDIRKKIDHYNDLFRFNSLKLKLNLAYVNTSPI